jgi:hypothetical protein
MNRRSFLQWLAVGMLATPRSLLRGMAADESPEAVALHAWRLMQQGDPNWLVDSLDPGALESLRRAMMGMVEIAHRVGQTEDILEVFGVESVRQVRALDDRAFFAAIWREISQQEADSLEIAQDVEFRPVAHVPAQEGRVYVLYRLTSHRTDLLLPIWPKVIGLERTDAGWALLPNSRLEGLERVDFATLDPADLLAKLRVVVTDVIGHVMGDDHGLVILQSVADLRPLRLTQIEVVPVLADDPDFGRLQRGEMRQLLRSLKAKYAGFG